MYRKVDDFLKDYGFKAKQNATLFEQLTDASLGQAVAGAHRTLGQIAWHTAITIPEMMNKCGLGLEINEDDPPSDSAGEIAKAYKEWSALLLDAIKEKWTDESLEQTDNLYGEDWKRGTTLNVLVGHEIHHIGQMTVLMRQAGLAPIGLFGPSKEEWGKYGMEEPPY